MRCSEVVYNLDVEIFVNVLFLIFVLFLLPVFCNNSLGDSAQILLSEETAQ